MKTDDLLNECLDALRSGRSVDECLRAHPEHAEYLEPLLRSAEALPAVPAPSVQFRTELGRRLGEAWQAQPGRRRRFIGIPTRAWAVAMVMALALFLSGVGTVWASSSAAPGDVLYPAKQATEGVRQALAIGRRDKAEVQMQLATRRVQEMVKVLKRDRPEDLERLLARLEAHLSKAEGLAAHEKAAGRLARLRLRLERDADTGLAQLRRELERMPAAKRARVRAILEKADLRYERAWRSLLEGEKDRPPIPYPPPWRKPQLRPDSPLTPPGPMPASKKLSS